MSSNPPPTLETAECEKLLDAVLSNAGTAKKKLKAVRNHCMAMLMLEAGLRVGELVSLRWSDLYFNKEPVRNIFIKPNMTKNKVEHSIPVSKRLSDSLLAYFHSGAFLGPLTYDTFAFANSRSQRHLTTKQVERIICKAAWKALGRPLTPHVLRHTFGTRLMRVTNEAVVQQLLGHKFMSSTQIYLHPNDDDKRQAIIRASRPSENLHTAEQKQQDQTDLQEEQRPGPQPASRQLLQPPSHW